MCLDASLGPMVPEWPAYRMFTWFFDKIFPLSIFFPHNHCQHNLIWHEMSNEIWLNLPASQLTLLDHLSVFTTVWPFQKVSVAPSSLCITLHAQFRFPEALFSDTTMPNWGWVGLVRIANHIPRSSGCIFSAPSLMKPSLSAASVTFL